MSKKVIRLTESDLEKIVARVIKESEHDEIAERIGDRLKAKASGVAGGLKARVDNRRALRKGKQDAIRTGNRDSMDNALDNLKDPRTQRSLAQLKSLAGNLKRDVNAAKKNFESVFTDELLNGLDDNTRAQVDRYYDALGIILDVDFMTKLGEA